MKLESKSALNNVPIVYVKILLSNRNFIDNSCFVGVDAADYCHAAGEKLEENNRHMRECELASGGRKNHCCRSGRSLCSVVRDNYYISAYVLELAYDVIRVGEITNTRSPGFT